MSKRILVIDDEELLTRSFSKLLEKSGYDVMVAKNGTDAVSICEEMDFELIISDIRMPGLNGVETIKNINDVFGSKDSTKPKIIFVSGYADPALEQQAKTLNPIAYMYKPFDSIELLNLIKEEIGK